LSIPEHLRFRPRSESNPGPSLNCLIPNLFWYRARAPSILADCLRWDSRHGGPKGGRDVAQRNVEIVIGRLITDEAFRSAFFGDPVMTLTRFMESGYDLTSLEMTALRATHAGVWAQAAEQIDPRLQKISL
jgi:hypothetical protein